MTATNSADVAKSYPTTNYNHKRIKIMPKPINRGRIVPLPEGEVGASKEDFPPLKVDAPETFNDLVMPAIFTILRKQDIEGKRELKAENLAGILANCLTRTFSPDGVREELILDNNIFYGLAGLTPSQVKKRRISEQSIVNVIRDHIQYVQISANLSSLFLCPHAIRDKLLTTVRWEGLLYLLPYDQHVLYWEAPRVAEYFLLVAESYSLFKVDVDEEGLDGEEEPLPDDFDLIAIANGAGYCWVEEEHFELDESWEHPIHFDPDEITLSLETWDGSQYVSFMKVIARHPRQADRTLVNAALQ